MTSQSHKLLGDGIVPLILSYVIIGLALVFGFSDCLVNGPREPSQKTLMYQKKQADRDQSTRCRKETTSGADYVDCLKRHGLGGL